LNGSIHDTLPDANLGKTADMHYAYCIVSTQDYIKLYGVYSP